MKPSAQKWHFALGHFLLAKFNNMTKTNCKLLGFSYLRYNRNFQSEELRTVYWDREENIGGFPGGTLVVRKPLASAGDIRDTDSVPRVWKIPWRRAWEPTPVFLPGESHGQSSLVGYSSWGRKELDTTEVPYHARTEESIRLCILFFILLNILVLCF